MAKEEDKKEENEEEELETQEEEKKKELPIKMIIVAVVAVIVLGGGFFAVKTLFLSGGNTDNSMSIEDRDAKPDIGPIHSMDTFIVNLLGGQGKSYLKAQIDLELSNEGLKEEISMRKPQLRDTVLTLLSSKTRNDIKTLEGKFQLREEIVSMMNQQLKTGKILNIYFTDFIVQ